MAFLSNFSSSIWIFQRSVKTSSNYLWNFTLYLVNNETCVGEDKWKPAPYIQLKQFISSISKCLCSLPFNFDFTWTLNQSLRFFLVLFYRLSGLIETLSILFEFSYTWRGVLLKFFFFFFLKGHGEQLTVHRSLIVITFICNESTPTRFMAAILDLAQFLRKAWLLWMAWGNISCLWFFFFQKPMG